MDRFNARGMLGIASSRSSRLLSKSLHQQHRELAVGEETHTQEQCDVGVTKVRHQLALLHVFHSNVFYSNISGINEGIVDLLSSTYQTVYFNLQEFLNHHR
jgi:hypothetical protein